MMVSVMFLLALLVAPLIVIVSVIAVVKSRKPANVSEFLRYAYLYLVIILSILMFATSCVYLVGGTMNLLLPDTRTPYAAEELMFQQQNEINNRNQALTSIITSSTSMVVSLILYLSHNKMLKLNKVK